jgi:hypothetical protein
LPYSLSLYLPSDLSFVSVSRIPVTSTNHSISLHLNQTGVHSTLPQFVHCCYPDVVLSPASSSFILWILFILYLLFHKSKYCKWYVYFNQKNLINLNIPSI